MSGEDDVRGRAADTRGEQLDEPGLVVPAVDETKLRATRERPLELVAIALDRERRIVRCEDDPGDLVRTGGERRLGGFGDAWRPVLHPREHRQAELGLERGPRLLGDRVQRRRLLDAEPPVALDEVVEVLRRDRAPTADVGVVRRHVGEPLRRAVRHQHDRVAHDPEASSDATVRSCTSEASCVSRPGSVSGRTPCPRLKM